MRRFLKWMLLAVAALGAIVALAAGVQAWQQHRLRVLCLRTMEEDQPALASFRARYPAGTSLAEVRWGLEAQGYRVSYSGSAIYITLGQKPSPVWYCGSMLNDLVFEFDKNGENGEAWPLKDIRSAMDGDCF